MKILGLSGSLRSISINSALLRATVWLAPSVMTLTLFDGLGNLPLFNPDREQNLPDLVAIFRSQVANADALLIASPEYAHGITGTMKNALDWLVSFEPVAEKPVAIFNASPRAHHADAALREVLRTMATVIVEPASITVPLVGTQVNEEGIISNLAIASAIRDALSSLHEFIVSSKKETNISFPLE
jgi:NAD(P)H-dependent FMN reductase